MGASGNASRARGIVVTFQVKFLSFAAVAMGLAFGASAATAGGFDFSDLEFQAGAMGVITPKYEGSKSYEATGVPFVFPGGKDGDDDLSFVDFDSVQYRIIKSGAFEAGPLAGVWLGRSDSDGAKLAGLGDIDAGLVIGGYGAYRLGYTKFQASYHHQVTGEDVGGLVRLRADAEVPMSPGFKLLAGVGANYATNQFMDKNFGVSSAQAATSLARLPVYNPGDGFKDIFVGAGAEVDLTERWTARIYGEYSRLIGGAADSPVIETEDQFFAMLSISYQFGGHGVAGK